MKKEQLIDMIGEAPDHYVKDAKAYKKKRRLPRPVRWMSGIAAVLAIVLLVNHMPTIPLILSARAVSVASDSRKLERPRSGASDDKFKAWQEQRQYRESLVAAAQSPIADFTGLISEQVLSGTDGTNRLWSPINAYIALAMTAELTGSHTQAQVLEVLGASDLTQLRGRISAVWEEIYEDNGKEISVLANSLWLDKDVTYAKDTMDILAHDYYASVYQGDLGTSRTNRDMANWIRNQTGGLLGERRGNVSLTPQDRVLTMASTIYFQSKWGSEFNAANNTQAVFHAPGGDVERTFMNKKEYQMNYYWGGDYSAVQMFMENGSSMWFILPDEGKTVNDVLASEEYMDMITQPHRQVEGEEAKYKWMKVNLSVPQFDVSGTTNLKPALSSAGLAAIFNPLGNDFSPSIIRANDNDDPVYLDSIHQDTRVKIDEKGVVAASYIELNFGAGAAMPPEEIIDFVLDRPFLFVIASRDNLPLFAGIVNQP